MSFCFFVDLFLFYFFEYFREKYSHNSDNHKKDNFANSRKEYSCNTKYTRKRIYNKSNLLLGKSQFHKAIMKMVGLISFHRVLSLQNTSRDHIYKVDQIESKDRNSRGNLTTYNDRQGRYEEPEHNST